MLSVITVLLVAVVLVFGVDLWLWSIVPREPFDEGSAPAAPDYSQTIAWSALPETYDPADLVAEGLDKADDPPADVFFIHPTNYFGAGARWNGAIDDELGIEMANFTLANQASVFNACCRVYAPMYRAASLHAFLDIGADSRRALDLAYYDVARAFRHFLDYHSAGRPFVLAGHSQGSVLLVRLLEEIIYGSPLQERLVAAYAIGHRIPLSHFETLETVRPCERATDIGCVVSFNAVREGTDLSQAKVRLLYWADGWQPIARDHYPLCTHPYSWTVDDGESLASDTQTRGAVQSVEDPNPLAIVTGWAQRIEIETLPAPFDPGMSARCDEGIFVVQDLTNPRYDVPALIDAEGSLHLFEYNLFYVTIRENVQARVQS